MRYLIVLLALAGIVVSALALHVHYYHGVEPCDINSHWDCGIVNHSRYSMIAGIPVAAIGIVGYALIAFAAFRRQKAATLVLALIGLGFALYLSNIEAHVLEVWCLYCVISQFLIALITLAAFVFLFFRPKTS
ncbi:MAG: vitamin K epoxide reductase family protein [Acidobacteriaceae bacterium]|jgi:vitamin-K-epoxide reductase (warfarin-sensitive)